jgi:hypothetical protein
MVELYLNSPIRLYGLVLNLLSTRTTLPFSLPTKEVKYSTFRSLTYQDDISEEKNRTSERTHSSSGVSLKETLHWYLLFIIAVQRF